MELNNKLPDFVFDMSENQVRKMVEELIFKLKDMERIHVENYILKNENNTHRLKEAEHLIYEKETKKELTDLRKQLQIRKDLYRSMGEERQFFLQQEERLNQLTKEKGFLVGQIPGKEECRQLRKENRDLKVAMGKQEKHLMDRIHGLEQEVEKLQKQSNKLQERNVNLQEEKKKIQDERSTIQEEILKDKKHASAEKQSALIMERRCSELEKQLQRAFKELCVKYPQNKWTFEKGVAYEKNSEILEKLFAERKRAERKDHMANEKVKQNEELKEQLSKLLPLDLISMSQCVIREQSSEIGALKAQLRMLQWEVEEGRREKWSLLDEASAIKKKFLSEKRWNVDLREALWKSGVKQAPPRGQPCATGGPLRREGGVNAETETGKPLPGRLPPILAKSQLEPAVASLHFRAPIPPRRSGLVLKQKSDAGPVVTKMVTVDGEHQ